MYVVVETRNNRVESVKMASSFPDGVEKANQMLSSFIEVNGYIDKPENRSSFGQATIQDPMAWYSGASCKWYASVQRVDTGDGIDRSELVPGARVRLSGDCRDMGLLDYNVRVSSLATILDAPGPKDKKIFLSIDEIDGEHDVTALVRISAILPL